MTENKTYKGYHLKKTGSRVNELLSRQFIVPTLDDVPTGNTLAWQDGEYVVEFRVGELCRVSVNNKWEFYRLHDISNGVAHWEKANASELQEDESIRNVTEDEYNAMYEAESLSDKTMYFVSKDGSPVALYIGKIQIAVREEGSKGFAYNFPIIF